MHAVVEGSDPDGNSLYTNHFLKMSHEDERAIAVRAVLSCSVKVVNDCPHQI